MNGRVNTSEQDIVCVRIFRVRGRRNHYWRRAAEYMTKALIRDFLEKTWKYP